jgi:two-component system sensor histidine kinase/response regulator
MMRKLWLFIMLCSSTYASDIVSVQEDQTMWTALFGLAIIGILSLYLSSDQLKRITKKHEEIIKIKADIEEKQQVVLETMGHNIEVSTKGIRRHKEVLKQNDFHQMTQDFFTKELERFEESETLLLDATNELIDFLRIKSGHLEIVEEPYKLHNVLNETYGFAKELLHRHKIELLYDIQTEVATDLYGDSKRLVQVLRTFLKEISASVHQSSISLKISLLEEKNKRLSIELHNKDIHMLEEEIKGLFSNYTLNETYKTKDKLDLYVASELIKQMKGTLDVSSTLDDGTHFKIVLPYQPKGIDYSKSDKAEKKRILIVEKDDYTTEVISKIIQRQTQNIDAYCFERFNKYTPNLYMYDMLLINRELFSTRIQGMIEKVRQEKECHVVELYNSHMDDVSCDSSVFIDHSLQKPLQNDQVYRMLEALFDPIKIKQHAETIQAEHKSLEKIEGITKESFAKFSHVSVLIAEDNHMNQKILLSVLKPSGIQITMVDNGEEALHEVMHNKELDMVFVDTSMPKMDGYEAIQKIRLKYGHQELPIIAIGSKGYEHEIDKMLDVGANTFLQKPFHLGTLYSAFSMYATPKQRKVKNINEKLSKYIANNHILNIQKGIAFSNSAIYYKELLREVVLSLHDSNTIVSKYMLQRDHKRMKEFLSHTLGVADNIGATSFAKLLTEMSQIYAYKEEYRIAEYSSLYKKEWNLLHKEIEEYLKS